jgi:Spy/CpxP family protein refolding chaperone
MMRRLADELDLTAAQRAALEPILKRAGDELRVLRRESMRQSGAVIEAMNAAVAAELTPEQRERFAVLKEAQKARMRALMEERQRRRSEGAERESDGGEREGGPRPGGPGGLEGPPRPPREE